jgi:hypothetical protein
MVRDRSIEARPATPPVTLAERRQHPGRDIAWILGMVASIAIPAAITLSTIGAPPDPADPGRDITPYGYTISLLLFVVPIAVMFAVRRRLGIDPRHLRALIWSSGAIASVGFVLDLFFGHSFFTFPNAGATIGVRLPAWSFDELRWVPSYLPIEEFGFYVLGSLFVIALYQWADAEWLNDYSNDEYAELASSHRAILTVNWPSLPWWVGIVVLGFVVKRMGPYPDGLPGYFLFIAVLGLLPTFLFLHTIRTFVNWRAFAFAFVNLTLISLLWEATLGVPYNWWNYHHERMLGISIAAWSKLPLEAVLLWLIVAWDCIVAYELFRVFFHMDRRVRDAMLGTRKP